MSEKLRFPPDYSDNRVLADGTEIGLRLLRPEDADILESGFEELSPESRYTRFFSPMKTIPRGLLEKLSATDDWNHLAILAYTPRDGHGVATARFIRLAEEPEVAEFAVAVLDSMHGRGLGKLLLNLLSQAARERGITRFRAHVLATNDAMVSVVHGVSPHPSSTSDGRVNTYEFELPELTPEGDATGPVVDLLRAAGRGLQFLLHGLKHD